MFEDQLKEQLLQLIRYPQWQALKSLELEIEKEWNSTRCSRKGDTNETIAHNTIDKEAKIDGMRHLINKAEGRANKE